MKSFAIELSDCTANVIKRIWGIETDAELRKGLQQLVESRLVDVFARKSKDDKANKGGQK